MEARLPSTATSRRRPPRGERKGAGMAPPSLSARGKGRTTATEHGDSRSE
jgi:hypothetical protein